MTPYDVLLHVLAEFNDAEAVGVIDRMVARFGSLRTLNVDSDGGSILFWAAQAKRVEVARALINAGVTLDTEADAIVDPGQRHTALHEAVENAHLEMVVLLLSAGGTRLVNVFDYVERTPLHISARQGDIAISRLLLEAGADPNARDDSRIGDPPLRCVGSNIEMAQLLLDAGADPTRPGWMRNTAIDDAARLGSDGREVLELYRQHQRWSLERLQAFLAGEFRE